MDVVHVKAGQGKEGMMQCIQQLIRYLAVSRMSCLMIIFTVCSEIALADCK